MKTKRKPSEERMIDFDLMQRITKNDPEAFNEFMDRFYPLIFSTVYKVLNHHEDTEDVVNEVLRTMWTKADTYRPEKGSLVTWICTTSRNRAIDRVRSVQRRIALYDRYETRLEGEKDEARASGREQVYRSDARRILNEAVVELTQEQREVIEMAYFEGLTQRQIAERINSPLGTVKARIRRSIQRLRGMMDEKFSDEAELLLASVAKS